LPQSGPFLSEFSHGICILRSFNNSQVKYREQKMSKQANTKTDNGRSAGMSIRDQLEERAWIQDPGLARRLGKKRTDGKPGWPESSQRIRSWQDRVLLILIAVLLVLFVIRTELAIAGEQEWGLQLKSDSFTFTEMALDTSIQLDITGLIARVEITQQFTTHVVDWAEGVYRFPLPADAAVDRMHIKVGERLLEGEIQEKQIARQTYQKARDAGQTATIVEQQRRNQFETRLANIGPGESIEITIGYLLNVDYSNFSYHLRLPMTFTPRWEPGHPQSPLLQTVLTPVPQPQFVPAASSKGHHLKLQARLVSSAEFATIESRYHDVDIRKVENGYTVELLNPDERSDRDFELSWTPALQSQPSAALTTFNDGGYVYAQLMLTPPLTDSIQSQAREVILVIDTSGSMEGTSLVQAKAALGHALRSLSSDDYFNLLQFNSSTEQLFEQSVPATRHSLYMAQNFITGLSANGGTDMEPALKTALNLPEIPQLMRQVVFITDGAVGNETELLQQVARDLDNSRMFTVAIGHAPNS
jgi:Ca-activated chloride channel family protein